MYTAGTQRIFYITDLFSSLISSRAGVPCVCCKCVLFNLLYSRNRTNSRWIFPRWFLWTPLSHSCKHTACSGLLSCIYTLWLTTKSERLASQKIVSILWFIRSLWYPRLPLFCTITNYISLSYFDNPSN